MKNILLILASTFVVFSAMAQREQGYAPQTEIGIVERLDEYIPDDIYIINTDGQRENLMSLLDKPTAIAIVYYRCPGICSPFMTSIAEVVQNSTLEIGKEYQILNISFDPTEGTNLSRANQNSYHMLIDKDFDADGWRFFTTDSLNSRRLTDAVGFKYRRQGLDFLHTSALIFVTGDGKITRYLHGTYFLPMDLKLAVVETAEGKSGPSMSRLLSYCYSYDPAGQAYVFNVTRVAGSIILFFAVVIFLVLVLKPKRKTTN
ncbi:MAG: SCO family protein [Bacteroidales bacterium]|nr:SCO family protein [Bacteroidales bacterium]